MTKNTRGHPSIRKNSRQLKVRFSISLPAKLVNKVEEKIKGEDRSDRLAKCIQAGYTVLTGENIT